MFKAIVFSKNILTFVVTLITYCCVNSTVYSQSVVTQTGVTRVVVDAGHGGSEPGAVGKNSKEKNLNLAVALLVGKMITDTFPMVEVIYTRKTDVTVPLHERSEIANKHNADLFISIHANSVKGKNSAAKGSETFVMGTPKSTDNMEVAKLENAVIIYEDDYTSKYEGYDPNSPESFIMFSLMQNAYLDQSLHLAALVQEEFGTNPIKVNRGVKQAGFLVLWRTAMPSILIEMGFISNPEDEKVMASKEGQAQIAKGIFQAFKNYKLYYDRQTALTKNPETTQKPATANTVTVTEQPTVTAPTATAPTTTTSTITAPTVTASTVTTPATTTPTVTTPTVKKNKVTYRVQIMASPTKMPTNAAEFHSFKNVSMIYVSPYYKYMVGNFGTLQEAQKYCKEVVRKKIKDAFVVCVENEKIVPLKK